MAQVRVLILRAPGTNCDQETAYAFEQAGADADVLHINRLLESPQQIDAYQVLCLPGGFSYGDDIAAGRIVAGQLRHHLVDTLHQFRDAGKLVLGICNGFQVLLKSGLLLPDEPGQKPPATLTWNDSGQFIDRWVDLKPSSDHCVFLQGIDHLYLPIAHAEGKFVAREETLLQRLDDSGQLALRYAASGEEPVTAGARTSAVSSTADRSTATAPPCSASPMTAINPNGSQADVAGVCDETGRVFGLMPHPERHIHATHHPRWTREPQPEIADGLKVFLNAVRFFE